MTDARWLSRQTAVDQFIADPSCDCAAAKKSSHDSATGAIAEVRARNVLTHIFLMSLATMRNVLAVTTRLNKSFEKVYKFTQIDDLCKVTLR